MRKVISACFVNVHFPDCSDFIKVYSEPFSEIYILKTMF